MQVLKYKSTSELAIPKCFLSKFNIAICDRSEGNSTLFDSIHLGENGAVEASFRINNIIDNAVGIDQQHTKVLLEVNDPQINCISGDGIYFAGNLKNLKQELSFYIQTADCLPIVYRVDEDDFIFIAAVHAGWRGFVQGIHLETLSVLRQISEKNHKSFFSLLNKLQVIIGPGIWGCSYPCGTDVKQQLINHFDTVYDVRHNLLRNNDQLINSLMDVSKTELKGSDFPFMCWEKEKIFPDLQLLACCDLLMAGLDEKNITIYRENSFQHRYLPSHRTAMARGITPKERGTLYSHLVLKPNTSYIR